MFKSLINNNPKDGAPFPVTPELVAIASEYTNRDFIADAALPYIPVGRSSFEYLVFPLDEAFRNIQTEVGRTGRPKVISDTAQSATASCVNHALDDEIPYDDIEDASENYDPVAKAAERKMKELLTRREIVVAQMVQSSSNYDAGFFESLGANDKFTNADADPLKKLLNVLETPVMRPNRIFFSGTGWMHFRTHPKVVKATNGNSGDSGVAAKEAVAQLLEVDSIYVGKALYNTAKKGQSATLASAWSNAVACLYVDETADANGGITYGFTARKSYMGADRWGGQKDDDSIGPKGGVRVRVGESRKELIVAKKAGYLLTSVY